MAVLRFSDIMFSEDKDRVRVAFMGIYYFYLDRGNLERIGKFKAKGHSIRFDTEKSESNVRQKFLFLLENGFKSMKCSLNGKPTLYIHRNSGIPLIGSNEFGIVDRGTNVIEVKPITTCNIDCIFCSVDHSRRISDIVVERSYLTDELEKVISIKKNKVNIHIGSQGDPSLYSDLGGLVKEIRRVKKVQAISIVTNGLHITKRMADALSKAGITHFHFSIHSLEQEKADMLANSRYPVKRVMEVCRHIAEQKKSKLLLVPVWLSGVNDEDIEEIIKFGKQIGAKIGVQNFLEYDYGKKPINQISMKLFFKKLEELEAKYDVDLTGLGGDLNIVEDEKLPKPFRKGDIIQAEIKARGRMRNSAIAVADSRAINVINCTRERGSIRIKIIRDKDNIFIGVPVY